MGIVFSFFQNSEEDDMPVAWIYPTYNSSAPYDKSHYDYDTVMYRKIYDEFRPDPIPMTSDILTFGRGDHNDVDLELYGHCNFISKDHCKLFYDAIIDRFVLKSYSCFGTSVNSKLFFMNSGEDKETEEDFNRSKVKRRCKCTTNSLGVKKDMCFVKEGDFISCGCIHFLLTSYNRRPRRL